jgi:hypothetical protein
MATKIWWAQIKAVIRLEMRKTFFAKRGLWIYVVAALPVLIFVAYIVASAQRQHQTSDVARQGTRALTYQDLQALKAGMTSEEVVALLGKPARDFRWTGSRQQPSKTRRRVPRGLSFFRRAKRSVCRAGNGKVEHQHSGGIAWSRDSIMFAVCSSFLHSFGCFLRMPQNLHEPVPRECWTGVLLLFSCKMQRDC